MKPQSLAAFLSVLASSVPALATPQPECGLASWYALEAGAKTASGAALDPTKMTAAHPSLPFGSKVRVEHLGNGKSVTVEITDRGPFTEGRIIDVSRAAADELGFVAKGVAKVRIVHTEAAPGADACR